MGLSAFEECSNVHSYCSFSIDRSLTTRLIESSCIPSKSSRFAHTPEWADGLDCWTSSQVCSTKNEISRRHLDFHPDLGFYLPRHEKPNSAPISMKNLQLHSKLTTNHFLPERIRLLLKKEKDLLLQNDLSHEQITIDHRLPPVPTNTLRQSTSIEMLSTNEIRLSLHHNTSKSPSPPPPPPPPSQRPKLNQDALQSLLKEHLTSLLTRGASTVNANRSFVSIPPMDMRQQIRTEPKYLDERFSKLDEFIPTQQTKTNQSSPIIFHQRSTLGLTVTPVDLSSQRNIQSVTLEKMAQQRNFLPDSDSSSVASSRPSTQPVPIPPPPLPTHLYQQQQRVVLRRNLEATNASPADMITSNESANKLVESSQHMQNTRKGPAHHRSSSKNGIHRAAVPATTTTIELLPPIISGKRLHIPLANHRYL